MRALVFDPEGRFVTSVNTTCLAELDKRHSDDAQSGASLEEEVPAFVRRYKHGNESKDFQVNLTGHWQLKPALNWLIRAAFPITSERYASPLDVHHSTQTYWSPFAGDSVFGAQHDCYGVAWNDCSQASPPSDDAEMDKAMRWAIASALTIDGPVMTVLHLASKPKLGLHQMVWHPLVHVLMKCLPRGGAPRIPADFWWSTPHTS